MIQKLYPMSGSELKSFFAQLEQPGDDPLVRYAASNIKLSDDFRNDLLGTKLLQEGEWAEALPYLTKVSQEYLDKQPIAFYAARRDYNTPAWYGWQSVGDSDYKAVSQPQHLNGNVKAVFCREMMALDDEIARSSGPMKDALNLQQAGALYQASRFGQCWYLSQYGFSAYEEHPIKIEELAGKAAIKLRECTFSSNPKLRAEALFALAYMTPDSWITSKYDWDCTPPRMVTTIHRTSQQYRLFNQLNQLLQSNPGAETAEMSRCDELRQWRKHC